MTKLLQVYKCNKCGNIVEVIFEGIGQLVCCNEPMELLKENSVDASLEKHVPVFEQDGENLIVKIGSIPHPMEEKHYIEWIEVIDYAGKIYRQFLKPGDKPEATFCIKNYEKLIIREYCNIHGLWKA
jgi:superoxide reductase